MQSTHDAEPAIAGLIPALSIDAMIAARDNMRATYRQVAKDLDTATKALLPFGVEPPAPLVRIAHSNERNLSLSDERDTAAWETELDRACWRAVFKATNLECLMDSKTRQEFHKATESRGYEQEEMPPLTKQNIEANFATITERANEYLGKCIEAVFRACSWTYKTNEPAAFGKRLVVSYGCEATWGGKTRISYGCDQLEDLERAITLLDGQAPPTYQTGIRSLGEVEPGQWVDVPSTGRQLMRIKLHKNRNAHVEFLHASTWERLNSEMADRYPTRLPWADQNKRRSARRAV